MNENFLNIALIVVLAVLVILMFRNSKKRKAQQEEMKKQIVPGADIMTNFGLFGKLVSVDELSNEAEVEVSPGVIVRVHRQTIAKVVTPGEGGAADSDAPRSVEEAMERANREEAERDAAANAAIDSHEPEFGERIEPAAPETQKDASKKVDE